MTPEEVFSYCNVRPDCCEAQRRLELERRAAEFDDGADHEGAAAEHRFAELALARRR